MQLFFARIVAAAVMIAVMAAALPHPAPGKPGLIPGTTIPWSKGHFRRLKEYSSLKPGETKTINCRVSILKTLPWIGKRSKLPADLEGMLDPECRLRGFTIEHEPYPAEMTAAPPPPKPWWHIWKRGEMPDVVHEIPIGEPLPGPMPDVVHEVGVGDAMPPYTSEKWSPMFRDPYQYRDTLEMDKFPVNDITVEDAAELRKALRKKPPANVLDIFELVEETVPPHPWEPPEFVEEPNVGDQNKPHADFAYELDKRHEEHDKGGKETPEVGPEPTNDMLTSAIFNNTDADCITSFLDPHPNSDCASLAENSDSHHKRSLELTPANDVAAATVTTDALASEPTTSDNPEPKQDHIPLDETPHLVRRDYHEPEVVENPTLAWRYPRVKNNHIMAESNNPMRVFDSQRYIHDPDCMWLPWQFSQGFDWDFHFPHLLFEQTCSQQLQGESIHGFVPNGAKPWIYTNQEDPKDHKDDLMDWFLEDIIGYGEWDHHKNPRISFSEMMGNHDIDKWWEPSGIGGP